MILRVIDEPLIWENIRPPVEEVKKVRLWKSTKEGVNVSQIKDHFEVNLLNY